MLVAATGGEKGDEVIVDGGGGGGLDLHGEGGVERVEVSGREGVTGGGGEADEEREGGEQEGGDNIEELHRWNWGVGGHVVRMCGGWMFEVRARLGSWFSEGWAI